MLLLAAVVVTFVAFPNVQDLPPRDLSKLLAEAPAMQRHRAVLAAPGAHRLQILVAEPVVRRNGRVELVRAHLGDPQQYFYPASSIKLAGAVAALLELNRHNAAQGTAHGLDSDWSIGTAFAGDRTIDRDETNVDGGRMTLRHSLRRLLLVSDNAAYNHCLELVGQDGVNAAMWAAGLPSARLWHRLSEARTADENARTRPVEVRSGDRRDVWPARAAAAELRNDLWTDLEIGTGYLDGGKRIDQPMSFATKNAIRLQDLQDLLVMLVRPEIDLPGKAGLPGLTLPQRRFLVDTLGELPRESANPRYDPATTPDHACKFVLRGARRVVPAEFLRVYDKIGRAYGFSVENAYLEDTRTGRGLFLAIVLYTNPDGILNDDRYAYEELAEPFLDDVAETIVRAVLTETR
jgi:hypothetical protein